MYCRRFGYSSVTTLVAFGYAPCTSLSGYRHCTARPEDCCDNVLSAMPFKAITSGRCPVFTPRSKSSGLDGRNFATVLARRLHSASISCARFGALQPARDRSFGRHRGTSRTLPSNKISSCHLCLVSCRREALLFWAGRYALQAEQRLVCDCNHLETLHCNRSVVIA